MVPVMIGSYKAAISVSEVLTKANTTIGETEFLQEIIPGMQGYIPEKTKHSSLHVRIMES